MRAKPTRYRVVVLTSFHRTDCDWQRSIMLKLIKLRQYRNSGCLVYNIAGG
jgi:hypothetical protein